jgi:hypothetical protein
MSAKLFRLAIFESARTAALKVTSAMRASVTRVPRRKFVPNMIGGAFCENNE